MWSLLPAIPENTNVDGFRTADFNYGEIQIYVKAPLSKARVDRTIKLWIEFS